MSTRSRPAAWFAAARQPRMLALLAALLLAALVCVRLGAWQLDRAQERREQVAAREAAAAAAVEPVAIDDVVAPQTAFTGAMVGRAVRVEGRYLADAQYLVPEEDSAGNPGVLLLAPLEVTRGSGAGALLPVARGWLPGEPQEWADDLDDLLAPPAAPVELVGLLAPGEAAAEGSGEDGELGSVSPGQLVNLWRPPIYAGYLRVLSAVPGEPPVLAPAPPAPAGGTGLPLQNLAYAAQWWIFGGFALAVWVRLVRDEAARREEGARREDLTARWGTMAGDRAGRGSP